MRIDFNKTNGVVKNWFWIKEKLLPINSQNRYRYFSIPARFSSHNYQLILKVFDVTHPSTDGFVSKNQAQKKRSKFACKFNQIPLKIID